MTRSLTCAASLTALLACSFGFAEPAAPTTKPASDYPLTKCVIAGEDLPPEPTIEQIDGREVRFCCSMCAPSFSADPAASHKKMDTMIVEAQKDAYKLDTCPVSGEKLGSMGEPVMHVDRASNTLVKLCCKACVKKAQTDAAAVVAKVKAANAAK